MFETPQFARELHRGEEPQVGALLEQVFAGRIEVDQLRKLRKSGAIAGEQVMPMGDRIVGYYALSYMVAPKGWLALAPVAIAPDMQGRGYGKRMIGMLTEWARLTSTPVVVLGAPDFYRKAGFSLDRATGLTTPFSGDHTMVAGVGDGTPTDTLIYPAAFGA